MASPEYRALFNYVEKLITLISIDPSTVNIKLFSRNLASSVNVSPLETDKNKAIDLVSTILKSVKVTPSNFSSFLDALNEIALTQTLGVLIKGEYERIKAEDTEKSLVCTLKTLYYYYEFYLNKSSYTTTNNKNNAATPLL